MQILIFALLLNGILLVQSQVSSFTDLEEVGSVEHPLTRNLKLTPVNASVLLNAFGAKPGSPNWNPEADLNGDEIVDIYDLRIFFVNTNVGNGQRVSPCYYASGDRIYDEYGKEVVWRGAGGSYLFHAGEHYQEAWQEHLPQIQAMGLNTIRLAFAFSDSTPNPEYGVPSADVLNLTRMDWVLDFLDQHRIKGILDLHNLDDMQGDFGSEKLYADWRNLAEHYRGDPRVAAYELFNEPMRFNWAPSITVRMDVAKVYAMLTDTVREADPDHIVIWESPPFMPVLDEVVGYLRPNLVFTFHRWWTCEAEEFQLFNPTQLSYMTIAYAAESRLKLQVPFWFGEFGSGSPFNSSNPEWLLTEQHLLRCEEQLIGWNLWMGRTGISRLWNYYLAFFPLKTFNADYVRLIWTNMPEKLTDHVLGWSGAETLEPYQVELWHNQDCITLSPSIEILVIVNRRSTENILETVSVRRILITDNLTVTNEEGTSLHPGDWNTILFAVG
jgi:hypothetical protein